MLNFDTPGLEPNRHCGIHWYKIESSDSNALFSKIQFSFCFKKKIFFWFSLLYQTLHFRPQCLWNHRNSYQFWRKSQNLAPKEKKPLIGYKLGALKILDTWIYPSQWFLSISTFPPFQSQWIFEPIDPTVSICAYFNLHFTIMMHMPLCLLQQYFHNWFSRK